MTLIKFFDLIRGVLTDAPTMVDPVKNIPLSQVFEWALEDIRIKEFGFKEFTSHARRISGGETETDHAAPMMERTNAIPGPTMA